MLTLEQYFKLEPGDQVRLFRDVFTVTELVDVWTHIDRVFISETGTVLRNAIYVIHLMAYHGQIEPAFVKLDDPLVLQASIADWNTGLSREEEAELVEYEGYELI